MAENTDMRPDRRVEPSDTFSGGKRRDISALLGLGEDSVVDRRNQEILGPGGSVRGTQP